KKSDNCLAGAPVFFLNTMDLPVIVSEWRQKCAQVSVRDGFLTFVLCGSTMRHAPGIMAVSTEKLQFGTFLATFNLLIHVNNQVVGAVILHRTSRGIR
ncbi:MAG: hypothetical protein P8013_06185, partial [Candidatus Sulfobium sp.]